MKLEKRLAGLLGSVSFLVVVIGGMTATKNPLQSMFYAGLSALVVGFIGHQMGYIVTHPANKNKKKKGGMGAHGQAQADALDFKPLTGEETFLDDLPL